MKTVLALDATECKEQIKKPQIFSETLSAWQSIVDTLSQIAHVPAALITHVYPGGIEVSAAANCSDPSGNPYHGGDSFQLGTSHYCEAVITTQQPLLIRNALQDPAWKNNPDVKIGMVFYYGIPILWPDGTSFGTLCILDAKEQEVTETILGIMQVFRKNIETGLELLCHKQEIEQQQERYLNTSWQLNTALENTVAALASALSWRDPYTTGHQQRVADLSVQIAMKLGLSDSAQHGLYLGASIHDIGKIYVPAEILSRPGKLSKPEFEMVRSHTTVGAEIVGDIQFPWPIQQMILQHHERLDGSGYPAGLTEDDIILEARIITVADVVEAMSSHRPYRSALGLDVALDAVKAGCGVLYDADVVAACDRVFRDDHYQLQAVGNN